MTILYSLPFSFVLSHIHKHRHKCIAGPAQCDEMTASSGMPWFLTKCVRGKVGFSVCVGVCVCACVCERVLRPGQMTLSWHSKTGTAGQVSENTQFPCPSTNA